MKKGTSKILSALLIATLVFTSAGVAFADSGESEAAASVKSNTATAAVEQNTLKVADQLKTAVKSADKGARNADKAVTKSTTTFNLTKMVTGNETKIATTKVYYGYSDVLVSGSNYKGVASQPITLSKGTVLMAVSATGVDKNGATSSSGYVYFGVYKDAALTQPVDSYTSVAADEKSIGQKVFKIASSGTYYLGVYSSISEYSTVQAYGAVVAAAYINGADRTLTNKKTIAVGQKDAQTNYFKFKAVQTGYLKVQSTDYGKVTLCNSKKKALSNATSTSYAPTYGVKKGTTYYVKVAANYSSEGGYQLTVTNSKITEKSGTKKSKAVTIKKKATKKGTIIAGSSQADWYKFKLTGKKTVKITMKGATNDKLKVIVYKGSKKIGSAKTFSYTTKTLTLKSSGKWPKGTYYIKVYRANSKSSGWYSLKWQ
ncbi:hypothetical protein LI177_06320 [bacterium 210820-DFI.6.37]|nr:hypothetical protein [bacterium 210820-DFI.6.37]